MTQTIIDAFRHTDIIQKIGLSSTMIFGGISFAMVQGVLQIIFILISIGLAGVTLIYTQEKRAALKKQILKEKLDLEPDVE